MNVNNVFGVSRFVDIWIVGTVTKTCKKLIIEIIAEIWSVISKSQLIG